MIVHDNNVRVAAFKMPLNYQTDKLENWKKKNWFQSRIGRERCLGTRQVDDSIAKDAFGARWHCADKNPMEARLDSGSGPLARLRRKDQCRILLTR